MLCILSCNQKSSVVSAKFRFVLLTTGWLFLVVTALTRVLDYEFLDFAALLFELVNLCAALIFVFAINCRIKGLSLQQSKKDACLGIISSIPLVLFLVYLIINLLVVYENPSSRSS